MRKSRIPYQSLLLSTIIFNDSNDIMIVAKMTIAIVLVFCLLHFGGFMGDWGAIICTHTSLILQAFQTSPAYFVQKEQMCN